MSDGNFNRNLLPYKNYQSGLRAGRATMRTLAYEVLAQVLSEEELSPESATRILTAFRREMEGK